MAELVKRGLAWTVAAPSKVNLADDLTAEELGRLGQDVQRSYDLDRANRADWDQLSGDALKLAQQVKEAKTFPWAGAANVKHPLITVASIQFAARAYPEIIKGNRVVKCQITGSEPPPEQPAEIQFPVPTMEPALKAMGAMGVPTPETVSNFQMVPGPGKPGPSPGPGQQTGQQNGGLTAAGMAAVSGGGKKARASRVEVHMNYQLTVEMSEWEPDMDRLLHVLPVIGQCYKKVYWGKEKGRNMADLVLPNDCVVNAKARTMETARRITHRLWFYGNDVLGKVRNGTWTDPGELGQAAGSDPGDDDAPHEFLEQHRFEDLDGDGYKEPYIITIHKGTAKVVRVVARWKEENLTISKYKGKEVVSHIEPDHYFVHYGFIPNPDGSMNYLGFGQLLTPINEAANSALNQMLDAGTLFNAGGGFIGRGVRLRGGKIRLAPGEWQFLDTPGKDLRDNMIPNPVHEPSQVLFQLLGFLVQAGKEISSVQDILSGDAKLAGEMPVGTIMALVEQGLKVYTAIYKRVYYSLSQEFKKLFALNAVYTDPEFTFFLSGQGSQNVSQMDYDTKDLTVVPVADPELSSDMQRLLKAQALKEVSGRPGVNEVEITRRIVRAIRPENMEEVLLTDDQISGKAPLPYTSPPDPQAVLASAQAEYFAAKVKETQLNLEMSAAKLDLELQDLLAGIGKKRADAMLSLAKAEATEAGPQLAQYKAELDALTSQAKQRIDLLREGIRNVARQPDTGGAAGVAGLEEAPGNSGVDEGTGPGEGGMGPATGGGGYPPT